MHVPKEDITSVPRPTGSSRALYSFDPLSHPDFVKVVRVKDPVHPDTELRAKPCSLFPCSVTLLPFWSILSKVHYKEQTVILLPYQVTHICVSELLTLSQLFLPSHSFNYFSLLKQVTDTTCLSSWLCFFPGSQFSGMPQKSLKISHTGDRCICECQHFASKPTDRALSDARLPQLNRKPDKTKTRAVLTFPPPAPN